MPKNLESYQFAGFGTFKTKLTIFQMALSPKSSKWPQTHFFTFFGSLPGLNLLVKAWSLQKSLIVPVYWFGVTFFWAFPNCPFAPKSTRMAPNAVFPSFMDLFLVLTYSLTLFLLGGRFGSPATFSQIAKNWCRPKACISPTFNAI